MASSQEPDQLNPSEPPDSPGSGPDGPGPHDPHGNGHDHGAPGGSRRGAGLIIARPFGIPVHVSPYWLAIALLYIVLYAKDFRGVGNGVAQYALAIVAVLLLAVSVLVHELSHTVVARAYKLPVRRIMLYPLGGMSEIDKEPETPLREFCVSAAGPALSLVLAAIGFGLLSVFPYGWGGALSWAFLWMNLVVGAFNLLPGLPLDGGRMLRAVLWKITGKASSGTIGAAWAGRVLAVVILAGSVYLSRFFIGTWVAAIFGAVLAAFMWSGATQSIKAVRFRERIPALQARRLARRAISVEASTPLAEAIRRADEVRARAVVVVDHDSKPIAILNEKAVMSTPPQRRPWIDAGTLARSIQPEMVLPVDIEGLALLEALKKAPASEYLLVEPSGEVYGVLAARDLDHVFAGV